MANQSRQQKAGLHGASPMCSVPATGPTPPNRDQPQQLEQAWIDWYEQRQNHSTCINNMDMKKYNLKLQQLTVESKVFYKIF